VPSYQVTAYGRPLERRDPVLPEPSGEEVLLRVGACGVCHSDIHLWDGAFDLGDGKRLDLTQGRELPHTLGHEVAGEVVAIGPEAVGAAVGDRRVVYPWLGCGACSRCTAGDEHLCPTGRPVGVGRAGGFADHVLLPHPRCLFDYAPLGEALAATYACSGLTAYGALRKTQPAAAGGELLVVGLGGVGMAALGLAPLVVDAPVLCADIDPGRLEVARTRGAAAVFDAAAPDAVRQLRRHTGGGVAAAIDFVGSERSAALAFGALAPGGTLVVVGLFGGALRLALPLLPLKQVTIRGSYVGSPAEMAQLLALGRAGSVPELPLDERPLAAAQAALDDLRAGRVTGRIVLRA
jgi:D-arabinose 1-dehydrogenase-like Zn-dependent alcohol dehydrogenase